MQATITFQTLPFPTAMKRDRKLSPESTVCDQSLAALSGEGSNRNSGRELALQQASQSH
jgi:hypothetical protein